MSLIDVMNHIENVFSDMGKLKVSKKHNLVKTIVDGRATMKLMNVSLGIALKLNPVCSNIQDVPLSYYSWEFFRGPNSEPNKAKHMSGHFTAAAVTSHMAGQSQLVKEPQPERLTESMSQDSREEPLIQVISKPSDSDSVSYNVSCVENVTPQIIG